eukprot:4137136-Amphidinium_carterae.2
MSVLMEPRPADTSVPAVVGATTVPEGAGVATLHDVGTAIVPFMGTPVPSIDGQSLSTMDSMELEMLELLEEAEANGEFGSMQNYRLVDARPVVGSDSD